MRQRDLLLLSSAVVLLVAACAASRETRETVVDPRPVTIPAPAADAAKAAEFPGLHNVVAYGDGLYGGSEPEDGGLETLAGMGIRTIISVDGAQPDAEGAAALGMRYVHLPIGYDGIDEERKLELARVVRDLPGPVYVHCHHGKHRSAGAAAAIGVALGRFSSEYALSRMKVSGTAPNYKGLYACATDTPVATGAQLASASDEFPSHWKTTGLVQAMVEIDHAFDNTKDVEKAGWKVPAAHPDLVPAAEIGRVAHQLRGLQDDPEAKDKGAEFLQFLEASTLACESVEKGILEAVAPEELSARFKKATQSCKDCHTKYRD